MASRANLIASRLDLTSTSNEIKLRMVVTVYRVPNRASILHVVCSCLGQGLSLLAARMIRKMIAAMIKSKTQDTGGQSMLVPVVKMFTAMSQQ
jgi:hypothetical protein